MIPFNLILGEKRFTDDRKVATNVCIQHSTKIEQGATLSRNLNLSIYKSQELPVAKNYNFSHCLDKVRHVYLTSSIFLHIYLEKIHASS